MRSLSLAVSLFICLLTVLLFSAKASAQTSSWTFCAYEGGTCNFSGTQQVRYGANGAYVYKTLSNGTSCTNSVFGDPAPGATKRCDYGAATTTTTTTTTSTSSWTFCAYEGGTCAFSGTQQVRYGANGSYVYKTFTGGTACTNAVFGDPAPGAAKRCDYGAATTSTSSTSSGTWNFCAWEGGTCAFSGTQDVRYGGNGSYVYKTLSNGTACTNSVFGDPAPGATKQCSIGGTASTSTTSTSSPTVAPTISASGYGPQSTITCPSGAVDIWPGQSIQGIVNLYSGATTFCLRAGVHYVTSAITPKTSNTFVGEYGAVLDGSNWGTTDSTQAAFRSHNQDIDYVTIRNLVIRNMPQRGIHAYYYMSDHWTIEYNEIGPTANTGIIVPSASLISHNYIHDNSYAGYMGLYAHNTTFDSNEIARNGWEQKIGESQNVTFRNNFAHHNVGAGIWFDSNNTGTLIEGNRVEDNGWIGVYYEISNGATIRNNALRRNADAGVMLSVSQNVQIYGNTFEYNFRGITYFLRCPSLGGPTNLDLANNSAHDNTIVVGTDTNVFASLFNYTSCTDTQVAPYLNGSKNLTFSRNTYKVPSTNGWYWLWGTTRKLWYEWQGMGQDSGSTVSQ
jgi:parallel beta-helix repeat protein